MTTVGVVVGNYTARSRTRGVAEAVASGAAQAAGLAGAATITVDLAELGLALFDPSSPDVAAAVDAVRRCDLVVVASPTYKATYTGLLKSFLDRFGAGELAGVVAVGVMVGAGPRHALAVEVHLRPLLVELGAAVPARGLYVTEAELGTLPEVVDTWLEAAGPLLAAAVRPAGR